MFPKLYVEIILQRLRQQNVLVLIIKKTITWSEQASSAELTQNFQ